MSTPTGERKPLAMIITPYGDFDGRKSIPAGWAHLPAANIEHDQRLLDAAFRTKTPFARFLVRLYRDGYGKKNHWEKIYSGIVVPIDRAESVAQRAG